MFIIVCESRGGNRGSGPPPPGKSQVIWVSIEIRPPLEKVDPGPSPGKCQIPSGSLEKYRFLCKKPIGSSVNCKISLGQKKVVQTFFLTVRSGPLPLTKIPGSAHDYAHIF